jgi:nucleotide-binding universal stress UspA family protein
VLASENDKVISEGTHTTLTSNTADSTSTDSTVSRFETAIIEAETSAASTIVDYAESKNVDLLVVGSKGSMGSFRTGLKKMLVGSTATEVLKYAHCPVLVVR